MLLVLTRQMRAVVKLQLEAVTAGYEARECSVIYARPIPGDRIGLQNISEGRTYNAGMCNDQNVLILVAL